MRRMHGTVVGIRAAVTVGLLALVAGPALAQCGGCWNGRGRGRGAGDKAGEGAGERERARVCEACTGSGLAAAQGGRGACRRARERCRACDGTGFIPGLDAPAKPEADGALGRAADANPGALPKPDAAAKPKTDPPLAGGDRAPRCAGCPRAGECAGCPKAAGCRGCPGAARCDGCPSGDGAGCRLRVRERAGRAGEGEDGETAAAPARVRACERGPGNAEGGGACCPRPACCPGPGCEGCAVEGCAVEGCPARK